MNVAVVIVSYNSGSILEKCLASLKDQTWQPDRVLVVDNNSDDALTLSMLEMITDAEVIYLKENIGYGAAINHAAALLEGIDYLCCLNPDAFAEPRWIEALMVAAARNPEMGSFASLMLKADDESIIDGAGDVLHMSGIPWRRYHGKSRTDVDISTECVFSPCAGAAMYSLPAFEQMGGFDESFFMYVEDIDLGFRLQLANYPCLLVPDAIVKHIGSAITGADSAFTVYHGHRNLVFSYIKNMPFVLLLISLPLHLLATISSIIILTLRGHADSICLAKWDALKAMPRYIAKRKHNEQRVATSYIWSMLEKWSIRQVRIKPLN